MTKLLFIAALLLAASCTKQSLPDPYSKPRTTNLIPVMDPKISGPQVGDTLTIRQFNN